MIKTNKNGELKGEIRVFDIAKFNYFKSGNVFTGSKGQFNFRIAGENDLLAVSVWYGLFCYEKSEIVAQNNFDFSADGLDEAIRWLENEYSVYQDSVY